MGAIELKYVQPTTAISLFNQEQQQHQSQTKLHNISVVFNQEQMCSVCSTNITKNLRSTHTKKVKAKFSQRSRHSRLAAKYLGAQPKDLLMFSRSSLCSEALSFKTKDLQSCIILYPSNLLLAIILLIC